MDNDFSVLASRIASDVGGLRGCVIVSRDGLVLGSYPDDGESLLRPAWLRFAALGDAERGFVEFAGELWVYAQRGPYAAFAVAGPNARPGLILEELENVLLTAEEARTRREGAAPLDIGARSKPRTPLHPGVSPDRVGSDAGAPAVAPAPGAAPSAPAGTPAEAASAAPGMVSPQPMVMPDADAAAQAAQAQQRATQEVAAQQSAARAIEEQKLQEQLAAAQAAQAAAEAAAAQAAAAASPPLAPAPGAAPAAAPATGAGPDSEVDRVALAAEFSQLLEESGYDDDEEE